MKEVREKAKSLEDAWKQIYRSFKKLKESTGDQRRDAIKKLLANTMTKSIEEEKKELAEEIAYLIERELNKQIKDQKAYGDKAR